MPKEFKDFSGEVSSGNQSIKESLEGVVEAAGKADEAHVGFSKSQQESSAAAASWAKSIDSLNRSTSNMTSEFKDAAMSIDSFSIVSDHAGEEVGSLGDEIKGTHGVVDLFRKKIGETTKEAEEFADGLGMSSGVLVGIGVGAVFAASKMGDLAHEFKDAALDVNKVFIEAEAGSKVIGMTSNEFEKMRDTLGLTRQAAVSLMSEFKEAVGTGVISVGALVDAGARLKDVFGGDQTERLKSYVDILKEIPSLEADLRIGADIDDQAAAIFALAESGKMEDLTDLQIAGMFGGQVEVISPEQAKMLDVAQSEAKMLGDIRDTLGKMFPEVLLHLGFITGIGSKALGVGGSIAGILAVMKLWGRGDSIKATVAQKETTAAQRETTAALRGQAGAKGAGAVGAAVPGAKLSSALTGVAVVSGVASAALYTWSVNLEKAGYESAASITKMGGHATTAAAGLASITQIGLMMGIGPKVAAALGAIKGAALTAAGGLAAGAAVAGTGILALGYGVYRLTGFIEDETDEREKFMGELGTPFVKTRARMMAVNAISQDVTDTLIEYQKSVFTSGRALERALGGIDRASNSLKNRMSVLQAEIAGLELEQITEIGGSLEQFDRAVDGAAKTTKNRFQVISGALSKEAAKILSDGKLNANDRKIALETLHKQELEAVKDFVDGMDQVIARMLKAPSVLVSEIETQMEKEKFEFDAERAGGFSAGSLDKFSSSIDKQIATNAELQVGIEKARKLVEDTGKVFAERAEKFGDEFKNLSPDIQKSLKDSGVISESGGDVSVDKNVAVQRAQELKEQVEVLGRTLEETESSLGRPIAALGNGVRNIQTSIASYESAEKSLNDDLKKAESGSKEAAEITGKISANQKEKAKLEGDLVVAEKELRNKIGESVKESKAIGQVYSYIVDGVTDSVAANRELNDSLGGVLGATKEQQAALGERIKAQAEINETQKELSLMNRFGADAATAELNAAKNYEKIQAEELDSAGKIADSIVSLSSKVSEQVDAQDELLRTYEAAQAGAELSGNALSGYLNISQATYGLLAAQTGSTAEAIKELQEKKNVAQRALAKATTESGRRTQETIIESAAEGIIEQEQKLSDATQKFGESLQGFVGGAVEASLRGKEGRLISEELELGDVLMEAAEFSNDFEKTIGDAFRTTVKASQNRAELIKKAAQEAFDKWEKLINAAADLKGGEEGEQFRIAQLATAEAEKQKEFKKAETEMQSKILQKAQEQTALKGREIDHAMSSLEAQKDFLSEMGGDLSQFMDIQNKIVQLERDRLTDMKEEYDVVKKTAPESVRARELETQIIVQQLKIRKQEAGVQKDIFEKILGKAFGEIRESVGARKRRGTDIGLLGVDGTRVKTRSGMFGKADAPGTIDERATARKLSGDGGFRNIDKKLLGKAPKRVGFEKELGGVMRGGGATTDGTSTPDSKSTSVKVEEKKEPTKAGFSMAKALLVASAVNSEVPVSSLGVSETAMRPGVEETGSQIGSETETGGGSSIKITGEMVVKFDNKMFKEQVVNIVGTAINDGILRPALDKAGWVNKKR